MSHPITMVYSSLRTKNRLPHRPDLANETWRPIFLVNFLFGNGWRAARGSALSIIAMGGDFWRTLVRSEWDGGTPSTPRSFCCVSKKGGALTVECHWRRLAETTPTSTPLQHTAISHRASTAEFRARQPWSQRLVAYFRVWGRCTLYICDMLQGDLGRCLVKGWDTE